MKLCNIKIQLKWFTTWLSVATLVMSPVALGKEAEKISQKQVNSALKEMGLDKQITVGEFFENTKNLYPERVRSQIEPVLKNYKNVLMPKFEVTSSKNAEGLDVPTVRVTQNGQILNLQFFGEAERYIKFQNTTLTEIDIINFNEIFERVSAGDVNLRNQTEIKTTASTASNKKSFTGYPTVTKEFWNGMTPEERANYMIHLRLLWSDAKKVLTEVQKEKKSGKIKTSAVSDDSLNRLEMFLKTLVPDAEAAPTAEAQRAKKVNTASRKQKVADAAETATSNDCLVAGYVTSYSSAVCDHKNIKAEYLQIEIVKKANDFCGPKKLACNPVVYGTPGGEPTCLNPGRSAEFQIATHYNGPCESIKNNRLGNEVQFLKDANKTQGRYAADNLLGVNLEADAKKFQEPNFEQTQSFLEGMLKFSGKSLYANGAIDESSLAEVIKIKNQFDSDIVQATASCKASSDARKSHEKNFWKACDQLQRRFLFVAEFFQAKCPTGSIIDPGSLKCACGTGAPVNPGGQCKPPEAKPAEPPVTTPPENKEPVVKPAPGEVCQGVEEVTVGDKDSAGTGAVVTECIPAKKPTKELSFWDKLWSGAKKIAPFAFAGLAIFAMYKIFQPKKPGLNPAGDFCPNGTKPPCGQVCSGNSSLQSNGQCGCAACPPGQSSTSTTSCLCGSGGAGVNGGATLKTCWDGSKVDPSLECPPAQYTCWDGSKATNALKCPEKPPVATPKTGVKK